MTTMLIFLLAFAFSILLIMAVANPHFFVGFFKATPKQQWSQHDKLQSAIQEKTKLLIRVCDNIQEAEKLVDGRAKRKQKANTTIEELNKSVRKALQDNNEDAAARLTQKLLDAEEDYLEAVSKLEEALPKLNFFRTQAEKLNDEIANASIEAKELEIEIKLAKGQTFNSDGELDEALARQRDELNKHKAAVIAARAVEDDSHVRFSEAAKQKTVNERLAEIRKTL